MKRTPETAKVTVRCAIYTRKSGDEGLDQAFNSLDAQRESAEAYISSMKHEGWVCLPTRYDDGGFTGGNMERPAVKALMQDVGEGRIDCVVVYKVDRLSRSLIDFARMMETFEKHRVSFVSVTQHFNTTQSMGRLTLNILLSFAQFERELASERTRDKIAAARRKGKWSGGKPVLGYDLDTKAARLTVNGPEADRVRAIFKTYLSSKSVLATVRIANQRAWRTKRWVTKGGRVVGGRPFDKSGIRNLLRNVLYVGQIRHHENLYPGEHEGIVERAVFDQVNEQLTEQGRTGGMYVRNRYGALLKGLIHCTPCGCRMGHTYTLHKGNVRYRYYTCYKAQKQGWHACPTGGIPAGEVESFIVGKVRAIGCDPALLAATMNQACARAAEARMRLEQERSGLEKEIGKLRMRVRRRSENPESAGHCRSSIDKVLIEIGQLEDRHLRINQELGQIESAEPDVDEVRSALEGFDGLWSHLSPGEQARLLRLLIERIDYDGRDGTIRISLRANQLTSLQASPKVVTA